MSFVTAGVAAALAGLGSASPARAADPRSGLHIQVVQGLFRDVPPSMVKVLGGPLRELIGKKTGLTGDVDTAPDALTLADRLKTNECQLGVFHGYEFAWAKARNPNLIPLVVTVYPAGKPQACVVVHKDSKFASLADLKDDQITIPRGTKGHCFAYLARQRGDEAAPKKTCATTTEEALDAVVNGTRQAALVDIGAYQGYEKLQPGAFKNLRVLCESEQFPQNVIAYSKDALTPEAADQLRRVLTEAHTTSAGKPLMSLWNIKQFANVPADYDDQLGKCAKCYPAPARPAATARGVGMAP
jgi:ABC-type phosphate/phosphonate transport system substrate-binding protein